MYVTDLIRIAEAGGSLRISCEGKYTSEIINLAEAINRGGGILILEDLEGKYSSEMIRIAKAAPGRVVFTEPLKK